MSTNKPDNPYAFPFRLDEGDVPYTQKPGITLRDYLAAQVVAECYNEMRLSDFHECCWIKSSATRAYAIADAMLAARKAKQ